MAKLTIDDQDYDVADGNNLLHACLSIGLDLPYFCWHPCMGSVGACRQCAVKQYQDKDDQQGRVVMACMTPASDGTRISIEDPQAKEFRAGVIELLMTNHPHDCPVCEEGGECHLQDMTEMSGHTSRVFQGEKRTHRNQYLGPFINHEMNRCISCYRCVRYYQDYAGGHDLDAMGAHNHVYFGRHSDGVLESPFAGNLVEVCPTGVFTDKTFSEHYSRKWDLQTSPSVCQHCAVGCNTTPGERYGTLKRITNQYNAEINGHFLCDRGRFGYGFVNSAERILQTLSRDQEDSSKTSNPTSTAATPCTDKDGIAALTRTLKQDNTLVIGSPRASIESNFALQCAVGEDNFYRGVATSEDTVIQKIVEFNQMCSVHVASQEAMEQCDAVLILGEDLTHTAPRTALTLRQTVRQKVRELADEARIPFWQDAAVRELAQDAKSPLFVINPTCTDLDDIAKDTCFTAPDQIARIGFAIAELVEGEHSELANSLPPSEGVFCKQVAEVLLKAKRPLIIAGASLHNSAIVESAFTLVDSLYTQHKQPIDTHFVVAEVNSLGINLLTGNRDSQSLEHAIGRIKSGEVTRVVLLENDLYRRASAEVIEPLLDQVEELIVIDHIWHKSAAKADWILPALTFAESNGTVVSSEGRAQRFFASYPVNPDKSLARDSWQWINQALGLRWKNYRQLLEECAGTCQLLAPITELSPNETVNAHGLKVPRMTHRASGRTAINASKNVSEPKQTPDSQTPLSFSMEGSNTDASMDLRNIAWAPGWNSNQSVHKFQDEVGGALTGGSSGIRLFKGLNNPKEAFTPPPSHNGKSGFSSIPLYHIFGSEELSNLSPPIESRAPFAYIAMNPVDAEQLNLHSHDGAVVTFDGEHQRFCLEIVIKPELLRGLIGLPMGLGGLHEGLLNHPLSLEKDESWKRRASSGDANVIASDSKSSPHMGATL